MFRPKKDFGDGEFFMNLLDVFRVFQLAKRSYHLGKDK